MKTHIDFYATLSGELLAKQKLASKLRKHWGVTTIDGVEVYKNNFTVWPGTETEAVKKVLKVLNIPIADIKGQSKDGLTRMYLQFNSSKMDTSSYSKEALAIYIEEDIGFNEWREFTLSITDSSDPIKFVGWTKEQIKQYVSDNFETLSAGYEIMADADTANVDDYLGVYVIAAASSIDFEVEVIDAGIVPIGVFTAHDEQEEDYADRWKNTASYQSGINLRYKYRRIGYLNDDSLIIKLMYDDLQYGKSTLTPAEIAAIGVPRVEAAQARSSNTREWLGVKSLGKTDTLWYKGHLRTSSSKLLKKHDYANVIFGSLDFGYNTKKTKGWKKLVAVVSTIVVFIVVLVVSGGNVGLAAGAAAIVASLFQIAFAKSGEAEGAAYIGRWAKVFGTISLIAGIADVLQKLAQAASEESLKQAAQQAGQAAASDLTTMGASPAASAAAGAAVEASVTASATVADITIEGMLEAGKNMLVQSTVSTPFQAMSTAMKVVGPLVEQREKNKVKQLDSLSAEVKAQQSEIADMYDRNLHMGLEDIRMYTKPINVDNAQFEVNYLYEGTKFEIQRPSFARYGLNIIT